MSRVRIIARFQLHCAREKETELAIWPLNSKIGSAAKTKEEWNIGAAGSAGRSAICMPVKISARSIGDSAVLAPTP